MASSSDHEHTASEATHHGGSKHHDLEDLENKADEPISHGSCAPLSPSQGALPLKVMPAPPPKENAWARRSTGGGANTTTLTATSSGDVAHKGSSSSSSDEHVSDENWLDGVGREKGVSHGQGGGAVRGAGRVEEMTVEEGMDLTKTEDKIQQTRRRAGESPDLHQSQRSLRIL
ncbi:eukaryotic translation initiation factor 4B-like isoform X2 [Tachysurus fulvidraco]|uniref:eukaryotic translation initiation factor 4B-like isoform X2 n=1 Tax=Tachysurus fulvidraco TaxID=1234273 RepID=UPI000F5035E1|nr:eukaryotic translation initiation factor 4B-like isoform X2 [Tachysurus fulvidraco]